MRSDHRVYGPSVGTVQVWWSVADAPRSTAGLLTEAERTRRAGLVRQVDRDLFLSAHVLVRLLVAEQAGVDPRRVVIVQECPRCGAAHGRPTVTVAGKAGPPVSMSHAGGIVLVATADAPVGVDVEPLAVAQNGVGRLALSASEQTELAGLPEVDRGDALIRWWVRKEAVLKATGHGMELEPRLVEVSPPHARPRLVRWDGPGRRPFVRMSDLHVGDAYAATVAVCSRRPVRLSTARRSLNELAV